MADESAATTTAEAPASSTSAPAATNAAAPAESAVRLEKGIGAMLGKGETPNAAVDPADAAFDALVAKAGLSEKAITDAAQAKPEGSKPTEPPPVPEGVKPADWSKAYKALKFDGYDDEMIDGMPPDKMVAFGLKRYAAQADTDKRLREAAKSKPTTSPAEEIEPVEPQPAKAETPAAQGLDDLIQPLAEMFGDDSKPLLEKFASGLLSQIRGQYEGKLSALEQSEMASRATLESIVIETALDGQKKDFPELEEPTVRQRVQETMRSMAPSGRWKTVPELCRAACRVELAEEFLRRQQERLSATNRAKANGQPVVESRAAPPKALADIQDRALDMLEKGMSPEQIRRELQTAG